MTVRDLSSKLLGVPWITARLAALAVVAWLVPAVDANLVYDRAAIARGEFWRLATGHLTHWNGDHLLWDVTMFVLLAAAIERRSRKALLLLVAGSMTAISASLWWLEPQVGTYRGLSGIDSALFAFLAITYVREAWQSGRRWLAAGTLALAVGFAAKIGYETICGATVFVDSSAAGFTPLPSVHLVGALVGLLVGSRTGATLHGEGG